MAKQIKIALARFYNAKFVTLDNREELVWVQEYKDMKVTARLSKTTSYSKWGPVTLDNSQEKDSSSEKYLVPGPEKYPAELYFEVIAYKLVDVTDEQYKLIYAENLDERNNLMKRFNEYEPEMRKAIEYCGGMLGLRITRELVSIPIFNVDQRYIFINEETYFVQSGFVIQVRSSVSITHTGDLPIHHSLKKLKLLGKNIENKATECLGWLLRGWSSEDYVLRFICFFTALEFILPSSQEIKSKRFNLIREKLISLIEESNIMNEFKSENLDLFIFKNPPSVSLLSRFYKLASDAKLDNWEKDIENFKTYHKIRNALLHRGDSTFVKFPNLESEALTGLELLSQKYIRFLLYGTRKEIQSNTSNKAIVSIAGNFKLKD